MSAASFMPSLPPAWAASCSRRMRLTRVELGLEVDVMRQLQMFDRSRSPGRCRHAR